MLAGLCDACVNVPVRGTVAAECNAKIFGVLFDCEWGAVCEKLAVLCEVGERSSTHFLRFR